MNQWDKNHIESILDGEGDNFTSMLFRLIAKADYSHQKDLYKSFPHETMFVIRYLGIQNSTLEYLYRKEWGSKAPSLDPYGD